MEDNYGRSPVEDFIWTLYCLDVIQSMIDERFPKEKIGMTYFPRFCKLCPHLDPKESEQDKYQKHWCHRYNRQVYHLGFHPEIVRVAECDMPLDEFQWLKETMNDFDKSDENLD